MEYRKLGKKGLEIGVIGLGTEFIWHEPQDVVTEVVHEALDHGVNYFDLWMPSPEIRDYFGVAIQGHREKINIAGHLGSTLKDGQYFRTRDLQKSEAFFDDLLKRLRTDYVDILMLHFIDDEEDYKAVFESGEFYELALRLKSTGKARYIGMSGHKVPMALKAVQSGKIDLLMFPVNPAFDSLAGEMGLEAFWDEKTYQNEATAVSLARKELYHLCEQQGVGIVAMKPYAGGWLLNGKTNDMNLSPVQCLSYCLAQPGVVTAIPGCKNIDEMKQALAFLNATENEKDFSILNSSTRWNIKGVCMYCNHCLPCPAKIDIGKLTRLVTTAELGLSEGIRAKYQSLEFKASDCMKCGSCMKRCPFGVDVLSNMEKAVTIFGQ
ncbi:MAG TPA: aldo/keto reductase [Bacillota bacterium]